MNGLGPEETYCKRCGRRSPSFACVHPPHLATIMSREKAQRVTARYELSKYVNNPQHDETDFFHE